MRVNKLALVVVAPVMIAAIAGADSNGVIELPAETVAAAFAEGQPLVESSEFKVHASRRDGAGRAEIHEADTDIFYVLSGSADFVTGGTIHEPEAVSPGEIRGDAIDGGNAKRIAAGDVVIVPRGVAHWFRTVDGPMTYYVVKVTREGR